MTTIHNFNFGKGVKATVFCRSRNTRNGFAHDCAIPALGIRSTRHYLNRTWESFDFESVIHDAFEKYVRQVFKVKCCTPVFDREYTKLTKRLTQWYGKGKFKWSREPAEIFDRAA